MKHIQIGSYLDTVSREGFPVLILITMSMDSILRMLIQLRPSYRNGIEPKPLAPRLLIAFGRRSLSTYGKLSKRQLYSDSSQKIRCADCAHRSYISNQAYIDPMSTRIQLHNERCFTKAKEISSKIRPIVHSKI